MGTTDGSVVGVAPLLEHGSATGQWNLVLLSEGYRKSELPTFEADANAFLTALLATPPFDAIDTESAINIYRVDVFSTDSGADDPAPPPCGGTGATPATYFDATFCAGGVPRAVGVDNSLAMLVADSTVAKWHAILVLVNSPKFGGASVNNICAVTTANPSSDPWTSRALHELGHGGFGLADEYEYLQGCSAPEPAQNTYSGPEPIQPNVTKATTQATLKWGPLVKPGTSIPTTQNLNCAQCDPQMSPAPVGTVGTFAGARHFHCGLFRPEFDCRMRHNPSPFCAVCQRWIIASLAPYQAYTTVPANGDADVDCWSATLKWRAGAFESAWEVQVATTPDFTANLILLPSITTTVVENGVKFGRAKVLLHPGTHYYWRVRKVGLAAPTTGWTVVREFTTTAKKPALIGPRSTKRTRPYHPWRREFSWKPVDGAAEYELQVAADSAFFQPILTPAPFTKPGITLDVKENLTQFWRVRAKPAGGDPANLGGWSTAQLITTMPKVVLDSPTGGELTYPWPVTLKWHPVMGAARYVVEIVRDKPSFGAGSQQKSLDVKAPATSLELNLKPAYLDDQEAHYWRVRVFGPDLKASGAASSLIEEGTPSEADWFVNDGYQTVPQFIDTSEDLGSGAAMWMHHNSGWSIQLKWIGVKNADAYILRLQNFADSIPGAAPQAVALERKLEPGLDYHLGPEIGPLYPGYTSGPEIATWVFDDVLSVKPGVDVLGYWWNVTAVGPEGLVGLGSDDWGWTLYVYPDSPELSDPPGAPSNVEYDAPTLAFSSVYTPSGKYCITITGSGGGDYIVGGNPGGVTEFHPGQLQPDQSYQWQVRAHSDLTSSSIGPVIDWAYPWSDVREFHTRGQPPQPPDTPQPVFEAFDSSLPVMCCVFTKVPAADHYQIEAQELDTSDLATPIGSVQSFDFPLAQIESYTDYVGQTLNAPVPSGWLVVGLGGTQLLHAYQWRVSSCAVNACSSFSVWAKWAQVFPWPFPPA